jgi:hypothetical protein
VAQRAPKRTEKRPFRTILVNKQALTARVASAIIGENSLANHLDAMALILD